MEREVGIMSEDVRPSGILVTNLIDFVAENLTPNLQELLQMPLVLRGKAELCSFIAVLQCLAHAYYGTLFRFGFSPMTGFVA